MGNKTVQRHDMRLTHSLFSFLLSLSIRHPYSHYFMSRLLSVKKKEFFCQGIHATRQHPSPFLLPPPQNRLTENEKQTQERRKEDCCGCFSTVKQYLLPNTISRLFFFLLCMPVPHADRYLTRTSSSSFLPIPVFKLNQYTQIRVLLKEDHH